MTGDDLRAIAVQGWGEGFVPIPAATRDALADLIDAAQEVRDDMGAGALDYHAEAADRLSGVRLHDALVALEADRG